MVPEENTALYPLSRRTLGSTHGYGYLTVEAEFRPSGQATREHKRIIGDDDPGSFTYGKSLVYSDTYRFSSEAPTYVYARHRATAGEFMALLDEFMAERIAELRELQRELRYVLYSGGAVREGNAYIPFSRSLADVRFEELSFLRLFVPFGDISVQFGPPRAQDLDEIYLADQGMIATPLEAPLFGFDATSSRYWVEFMAQIHWASELIQPLIISEIISEISCAFAYA